ncbi:MAG: helicase C-terminal domain-containing protein [Anaerolineales bacterium]|nr:helicase C-terminal domain-containing protein [Anaerolineales bacterium]
MKSLIAFDLETTGLDTARDAVIEIGAVRFRGERIEDQFQTLINPGRPLDPVVCELTGLNDAMLSGAPRLIDVIDEFEAFVGDLPLLGHSVQFDLAFMQREGLFKDNEYLDTFDLASVLLPASSRYNLRALAQELGIPVFESHRALEDAQTTRLVFLRLFEKTQEIPGPILDEITRLGQEIEWGAGWVFDQAYETRLAGGETFTPLSRSDLQLFPVPTKPAGGLKPARQIEPLDVEEIAAIFEPGGSFSQSFEGYENRPQQINMARAVTEALNESKHLLVEAGTGTGKSMAYLGPAYAWAAQNGERVVISTNTINLQDQLIHKDIPDLSIALDAEVRGAVLKGRGNYLCPRRFDALRKLGPRSTDEIRLLSKLLLWLSQGGPGDRTQLNLPRGESIVWSRLSADNEDCSLETCASQAGGRCPYYQARMAAEHAHVVIVNHALLLADIAVGNRVIPEYNYLVVDEAHHLESATTNGLSFSVTEAEVQRVFRDLGSRSRGLLRQILDLARRELPPEAASGVDQAVSVVSDRTAECTDHARALFERLGDFMLNQREGKDIGRYGQQVRIVASTRTLPDWERVEFAWEDLRGPLGTMVQTLGAMSEDLETLSESGIEAAENLSVAARIARRSLGDVYTNLEAMIFEPDTSQIFWVEISARSERISLHAAPLEAGPLVEKHLWFQKEAVIMTSATLTTAGEFDYIRRRLYAHDADELALGTPFDHESSTLLYLVNDIPEPFERQKYQHALENGLLQLFKATGGRALGLFTSYAHLQRTAQALAEPLAAAGIYLYEQSGGASRHTLLESFRSAERAVLLGTRSFWEGVDVPGEALSVLAIVRLPFDVPSDPIIAARSETYESPFQQYTVPEAILRFRQGFGRLIRTRSDRGIVAIFDRRILTKSYGRAFVDSLPRCTVRTGNLAGLPDAAERWLGL